MQPRRAAIVATLLLVTSAGAARADRSTGRRIDLDPATLGTPMMSPTIDVRLAAEPSAVGMQCDGVATASSTHDPVLAWRLTAPSPDLRVTITGARAAVHDDNGTWWCSDAHGDVLISRAHAGNYTLYVFADADKATVSLVISSPALAAQLTAAARDRAPELHIGPFSRPDPVLVPLTASRAAWARDLRLCLGDRDSFTPLARVVVDHDVAQLRVAERGARTVGGHAARLALVDASGHCVAPGPVAAGTYALWAELDVERVPKQFWIEVDDASRPIEWPDAAIVDLSSMTEPLVDDGKIAAPAPRPTRAATPCKPLAPAPSFSLASAAPQPGVELHMVWTRRPHWFLVEGPGVSICSADGDAVTFDAAAGRYFVFAGGDVGADFKFLIHRHGAAIDPLTTYATPAADLSPAERVVAHFYPFFEDSAASALFAVVSDRLVVYAKHQPLLVRALDHDTADVLTYDGHTLHVAVRSLSIKRPKIVTLPDDADPATIARLGATTVTAEEFAAEQAAPDEPVDTGTSTPTGALPADLVAAAHLPPPPTKREVELTVAFPVDSRLQAAPRDTTGESLSVDATATFEVGAQLRVGGALEVERWRNEWTATRNATSGVFGALAAVRFDAIEIEGFRVYAQARAGLGVSTMTPELILYNPHTPEGHDQMVTISNPTGLAAIYELSAGVRRRLTRRLSLVAELAGRGVELRHDLVFTDGFGTSTPVHGVRFVELDARLGLSFGF